MPAVISTCGTYRYTLHRKTKVPFRWVRRCVFIMLNPSTADATKDDPTLKRCIGFAENLGCTDLTVVNLYALRSTDPDLLLTHPDPVGPENLKYIKQEVEIADTVIAAWGAHKATKVPLAKYLIEAIPNLMCLAKTKEGNPRHPLYLPADSKLIALNDVKYSMGFDLNV